MTRLAPTLRPLFAAVCLGLWLGAAGCSRGGSAEPAAAQAPATVSVTVAPVQGVNEPVTIEATGSFEAQESSDVAPEASGRVIATPVDVGQFVNTGAVLVRIQGVDAGLRLEEARASAARAEANVKLAESQNTLAQTTAQRYASLLATGDVSKTVADQARTQAETSVQSVNTALRLAGRGPRAAGARREGGRRRRRRGAVLGIHQRPQGLARRVRAAVDRRRDAAEDRSAAPAADDSRRAGGSGGGRAGGHGDGGCLPRPRVQRTGDVGEPGDLRRIALVHRRGARAQSGGEAQARDVRGRDDRSGTHGPRAARAAEGGRRGRQHELVQDLCDR